MSLSGLSLRKPVQMALNSATCSALGASSWLGKGSTVQTEGVERRGKSFGAGAPSSHRQPMADDFAVENALALEKLGAVVARGARQVDDQAKTPPLAGHQQLRGPAVALRHSAAGGRRRDGWMDPVDEKLERERETEHVLEYKLGGWVWVVVVVGDVGCAMNNKVSAVASAAAQLAQPVVAAVEGRL